jgi:hypothetical protein
MVHNTVMKPLGTVLQRGGLISPAQVEVALVDQRNYPNLRLGDVLELRGWMERSTLDFFSEQWPQLVAQGAQHPIGVYWQQAGLLTQKQLDSLLEEQLQTGLRIGALAVLRGWLKQETLDLFLQGLAPEHRAASAFMPLRPTPETEVDDASNEGLDMLNPGQQTAASRRFPDPTEDDIPWVD